MKRKYSYSKETEEKALHLFEKGCNIKDIASLLKLTKSTARLLILRNGKLPVPRYLQIREINFNPFNQNTQESEYWLGYFIADGSITNKKYGVAIHCKTDPKHLQKYGKFIGKTKTSINNTKCLSITFNNEDVHSYLKSIGISTKKSKYLDLRIPLTKHMLRGIFDGDGSISQGIPKITIGSENFAKQIQMFLDQNGIESIYYIKDKNKYPCYDLRIKGDYRFLFYKFLYEDAIIYLERKKNNYRSALKKFKVKNIGLIAGILPYIAEEISSQD